jgi:hypothetical protein
MSGIPAILRNVATRVSVRPAVPLLQWGPAGERQPEGQQDHGHGAAGQHVDGLLQQVRSAPAGEGHGCAKPGGDDHGIGDGLKKKFLPGDFGAGNQAHPLLLLRAAPAGRPFRGLPGYRCRQPL